MTTQKPKPSYADRPRPDAGWPDVEISDSGALYFDPFYHYPVRKDERERQNGSFC